MGLIREQDRVRVGLAAPAAFAQGPVGTPAPRGPGYGGMMGGGFGGMMGGAYAPMMGGNFGGPANSLIAVAAKTIGIEQADPGARRARETDERVRESIRPLLSVAECDVALAVHDGNVIAICRRRTRDQASEIYHGCL